MRRKGGLCKLCDLLVPCILVGEEYVLGVGSR